MEIIDFESLKNYLPKTEYALLPVEVEINTYYIFSTDRVLGNSSLCFSDSLGKKIRIRYISNGNYGFDKKLVLYLIKNCVRKESINLVTDLDASMCLVMASFLFLREKTVEYKHAYKILKEKYGIDKDDFAEIINKFSEIIGFSIYATDLLTGYINFEHLKYLKHRKRYYRSLIGKAARVSYLKMLSRFNYIFGKVHGLFRHGFYTKMLEERLLFSNIKHLSVSGSSSGCLFFSAMMGEKKVFIKGFEPKGRNAIAREKEVACQFDDYQKCENLCLNISKDKSEYAIFPFVDGVSLKEYLDSPDLSEKDLCCLFKEFNDMVDQLFLGNVVHRDIRLDNIIISNDKTHKIILLDYGCASVNQLKDSPQTLYDKIQALGLGDEFKGGTSVWDDAASMVLICDRILEQLKIENDEKAIFELGKLESKIGRLCVFQ